MKKIAVLTFCFRDLPNYFPIWLKAAGENKTIDFIVVTTDKTSYISPHNVKIINKTFDEIIAKAQAKLGFKLNITDPYKLCDLRPAFGYLFSEWFKGYDFWGGCDLDIVLGDIRKFITESILEKNDKILTRDHFHLYRNTKEVNERFMLPVYGKKEFYKRVFTDDKLYCFGERKPWGMFKIYQDYGFTMYDEPIVADIQYKNFNFIVNSEIGERYYPQIFAWEDGQLYRYKLSEIGLEKDEFMYIHLQKRPMNMKNKESNNFIIVPNEFSDFETITPQLVNKYGKKHIFYGNRIKQIIERIKNPFRNNFYMEKEM